MKAFILKKLNPHFNADLLNVLHSMGHGDELLLSYCNFPSDSVATVSFTGKLIRMEGLDIPNVARAFLSGFPLDSFFPKSIFRMEVFRNPSEWAEFYNDMRTVVNETSDREWEIGSIDKV